MNHPARLILLLSLAGCTAGPAPVTEGDLAARLERGRMALARGQAAGALPDLAAAVEDYPEAATDLARAAKATGRQEEALDGLERALSRRPGDTSLLFVAATLEMDLERLGEAEDHLRTVLGGGLHIPALIQLNRLLAGANRIEEAHELLRSSEDRICGPVRTGAGNAAGDRQAAVLFLQELGQVLLVRGDLADAARQFEEAIRYAPERAAGHYGLGLVLIALGDLEGAAGALAEARRCDPDHLEATYQAMNVAERRGRPEEAEEARERFEVLYRASLTAPSLEEEAW